MHSTSVSLVPFTTHQSSSTDVTALFPPVTFTTYWCRSWSLEWLAQCVVPDRRKGAKKNKIDNVYLSIILLVYCICRAIFGEGVQQWLRRDRGFAILGGRVHQNMARFH